MAGQLARAVARLVERCPYAESVHDLITKQRVVLGGGYLLDLYYNEALEKYSYTLVDSGKRVLGWDNAPHHPRLKSFPHHFHAVDGRVLSSSLVGDPERDIDLVVKTVNRYLRESQSRGHTPA